MEEQLKKEIESLKQELEQSKKDFEYRKQMMQLLQYPIIVLSIIAGLFLAQFGLGLKIGNIAVGEASIEFQEKKEDAAWASNMKLTNEIITLKSQIKVLADSQHITSLKKEITKDVYMLAKEEASPDEALLTKKADNSSTYLKGKDGYIWIGNADPKDPENSLSPSKIKDDGESVKDLHTNFVDMEVTVTGNMVLRQTPPQNDDGYFNSIERVGVIPENTRVQILEAPYSVKRKSIQYWARVRVLE